MIFRPELGGCSRNLARAARALLAALAAVLAHRTEGTPRSAGAEIGQNRRGRHRAIFRLPPLTLGYRATAAEVLAVPCPPQHLDVSVRLVTSGLDALDRALRALNPDFGGFAVSPVGLVALAEAESRAVGYWAFTLQGSGLVDSGVFVAPEWRGRAIAARLLRAATEAHPTATIFARTSARNRASRRMLRRAGLRPYRVSAALTLPLLGRLAGSWTF